MTRQYKRKTKPESLPEPLERGSTLLGSSSADLAASVGWGHTAQDENSAGKALTKGFAIFLGMKALRQSRALFIFIICLGL